MKATWEFLCRACDIAGLWEIDLDYLEFFLGEAVTMDEILESFGDRVEILCDEKLYLTRFVEFQQNVEIEALNPANNAHRGILKKLERNNLVAPTEPQASPKSGASKPQARGPGKSNSKSKGKSNSNSKSEKNFDFEPLYKKYPKKVGKSKGLEKAERQIKTQEEFDQLSQAIDKFKKHHEAEQTEPKFVPYFSTFMSTWRDWLDDDTGRSTIDNESATERRLRLIKENRNEHNQSQGVSP